MSDNLLAMYSEAVECYAKFEEQWDTLPPKEILECLHICLNSLDDILYAETSENDNTYFIAIASLKQQVSLNILQMEKICNESHKNVSTVEYSVKYKNSSDTTSENIKFKNIIDNSIIKLRTNGLCDIAGLNDIKDILRTYVVSPIHQPQLYKNLKYSNCVLLFGPPGTGKTRLVDAIAVEAGATLLCGSASNILSQYLGQSEKILRSLFEYIYHSDKQTILFVDEIDGLCRERMKDEADHSRRLKTEFMCQISKFEDCRKGFLICATNCPWELDVAFVRRFQKRMYVPLPNSTERYELLKLHTQNSPLEELNSWEPIVNQTEGYSGSDIVQLIQHALTAPIIELQQNKVWKLLDNTFYEALSINDCLDGTYSIHYSDFKDLPPNTVRVRKACMDDLTQALQEVKRSVSEDYVKRYEAYANNLH